MGNGGVYGIPWGFEIPDGNPKQHLNLPSKRGYLLQHPKESLYEIRMRNGGVVQIPWGCQVFPWNSRTQPRLRLSVQVSRFGSCRSSLWFENEKRRCMCETGMGFLVGNIRDIGHYLRSSASLRDPWGGPLWVPSGENSLNHTSIS
jgi:hypothetical protein